MEISGKLFVKLPVQTGEGKNGTWKKQNFVIETMESYPKKICFALWGDKIDLNIFQINDIIKVYFDAESREYNGNWYTDLKCWKIENNESQHQAASVNGVVQPPLPPITVEDIPSVESNFDDDLPF